jgi:hypothetical protein
MIFWALRVFLALLVLPLLLADWRLALVVAYALIVDFLTLIGMTLPTFGIWTGFLLFFPVSIPIGIILSLGKAPSHRPLLACASALLVLHLSPYADGLLGGATRATVFLHQLPSLGVLVLAVGLGIELPLQGRRLLAAWLRARARNAAPNDGGHVS